ncbi:hypothetical protein [Antarcticirhabdus aurantiaca]|uniref:Uncharacterized protein n=1 Tax=Antarcticirhabdus aurantiaca TaxID=2606717 RepID=A0ACD4NSL8_9HYPH|nr:hypothetical protein [Antarcticirhabdus aurantiaca]WAJ29645.1 hypothetical protein OXU80_05285 [Jeongeuplla avenae]
MGFTKRLALALLLPAGLAACASSGGSTDIANSLSPQRPATAEPVAVAGFEAGTQPEFCPNVTLREGTSILERPAFVASITGTSRDCRVADGKLFMHVGVAGRVMPQGGTGSSTVRLPIRVAVTRGSDVLYSKLGSQAVTVNPGGGAQIFSFVDTGVALAGPSDRSLTVFVGFDEGPPAGGGRTAAAQ